MKKPIIEIEKVSKRYDSVQALRELSLSIEEGTVHGLLGPNGAGKTTLVRILATLLLPDSGRLTVDGIDVVHEPDRIRQTIGLAGQYAAVDAFLTGRETLEMVGALYHLPKAEAKKRAAEILERLTLTDAADRPARTYSGGMRRRLDLGASLIVHPKVIFLDEPTTGLDPRTRLELWELIRDLAREGSTVLLTTQYLEEADALAKNISVIDQGTIVAQGTPSELKSSLGRDIIEVRFTTKNRQAGRAALRTFDAEVTEDDLTGSFRIPAREGSKTLLAAAQVLQKAHIEPEEISLHRPSLDDVFLAVTGHTASAKASTQEREE